ncbi:hypothetical protein LAZ40_09950 [Cereibacter sphaeroides]|uniref:hypothetical protein n=1 Tax=Cereibacter sphaeroides TaxID=1063 RepID=UPI001F4906A6|nr:hypothetical protein [Cereibacter sphaeroides]MCE6959374.1 hypothetical protein [Cereibacter sphaeroides]MCE6972966.1 hypothetical protein [Cereibacter sphaeroides]
MTISLKLDSNAVEKLIGDDPEVRIDLQRAVVANIVRKTVAKDVGSDNMRLIGEAARKVRGDIVRDLSEEAALTGTIELIFQDFWKTEIATARKAAGSSVKKDTLEVVEQRLATLVREALEEKKAEIQSMVEARVDAALERLLTRIDRQVDELGDAWKAEAAKAIRADVVARLNGALAGAAA